VHDANHPVHVTIRRVRLAPSFRTSLVRAVILGEFGRARRLRRNPVRVVQYSIQDDHLHLMVEGRDAKDLAAQMRNLFSRVAMMINAALGRRGALFRDRHHRHALGTPREVRNALVYILFTARKHARIADARTQQEAWATLDSFTSAPWCAGWAEHVRPPDVAAPLSSPRTWLARVGWKRAGGAIRFDEAPL
jgi:REP element-mobilizing transposase RayT